MLMIDLLHCRGALRECLDIVCTNHAVPHSTLSINECGFEQVQLIELLPNERAPLLLLLAAVSLPCYFSGFVLVSFLRIVSNARESFVHSEEQHAQFTPNADSKWPKNKNQQSE